MNKNILSILSFSCLLLTISCSPNSDKEDALLVHAKELAHSYIITDGHVDLPYRLKVKNFRLEKEYLDVAINDKGNFDYQRAKEGGLDAPFMSIYIPSSRLETPGASKQLADSLIDMVEGITDTYPDKFALATSPGEVEENFRKGLISLPMGMENGSPVEDDLANVAYFFERGIRYITLTHSKDNQICDSSYDTTYTWNGLSPFGEEVVKEMNRLGIMVDISHVSDSTFYDVIALTRAPVIASHSSCRYFTPGFERNMNDDMIRKLAENGGVIQINFGSDFLDSLVRNDQKKFSDIKVVADHIEHVAKLVGPEHVAFGSDFDGVGDSLPEGLKDVSDYPNLIRELLARGFSDEDIEKICYKNVFRVWNQVEQVARTYAGS